MSALYGQTAGLRGLGVRCGNLASAEQGVGPRGQAAGQVVSPPAAWGCRGGASGAEGAAPERRPPRSGAGHPEGLLAPVQRVGAEEGLIQEHDAAAGRLRGAQGELGEVAGGLWGQARRAQAEQGVVAASGFLARMASRTPAMASPRGSGRGSGSAVLVDAVAGPGAGAGLRCRRAVCRPSQPRPSAIRAQPQRPPVGRGASPILPCSAVPSAWVTGCGDSTAGVAGGAAAMISRSRAGRTAVSQPPVAVFHQSRRSSGRR